MFRVCGGRQFGVKGTHDARRLKNEQLLAPFERISDEISMSFLRLASIRTLMDHSLRNEQREKANTERKIKSHWNEAHKNGCCVTLASYQLDKLTEMDFLFSLPTQKGAHQKNARFSSPHSPTDLKKRLP